MNTRNELMVAAQRNADSRIVRSESGQSCKTRTPARGEDKTRRNEHADSRNEEGRKRYIGGQIHGADAYIRDMSSICSPSEAGNKAPCERLDGDGDQPSVWMTYPTAAGGDWEYGRRAKQDEEARVGGMKTGRGAVVLSSLDTRPLPPVRGAGPVLLRAVRTPPYDEADALRLKVRRALACSVEAESDENPCGTRTGSESQNEVRTFDPVHAWCGR